MAGKRKLNDLAHAISMHAWAMAKSGDLQKRREEIAATLKEEAPVVQPVTVDIKEFEAMFSGIVPSTPEQIRARDYEQVIAPRLKDFGFEERYRQDDLLTGPDPRIAEQAAVLAKVQARFQGVGAIVALVGPRGTGKTTIAAQLAAVRLWEDWEIAKNPQGRPVPSRITAYRKLSAIVAKFKAYYGDFGTTEIPALESMRKHLAKVECLVIDELSEVADESKHKDRILTDILDLRYAAKRDTLLISNQTKADFVRTMNPSITSRLEEHGSFIRCEWESFRATPVQHP